MPRLERSRGWDSSFLYKHGVLGHRVALSELVFVAANPAQNLVESLVQRNPRPPIELLRAFAVVGEIDRQIAFSHRILDGDVGTVAEFRLEQVGSFAQ